VMLAGNGIQEAADDIGGPPSVLGPSWEIGADRPLK